MKTLFSFKKIINMTYLSVKLADIASMQTKVDDMIADLVSGI